MSGQFVEGKIQTPSWVSSCNLNPPIQSSYSSRCKFVSELYGSKNLYAESIKIFKKLIWLLNPKPFGGQQLSISQLSIG